ncbi:hypothetical protein M8332_07035 (plasmid) [Fructilactobacillus ixorae]|uniref:Uncharacterized protein n=1 Tax=Fructilactobacillus ixorae TaxID=1750535 RepID=A0ABY5C9D3_9LACO|nr:hypothetical protein [Fructilactobacillus ixorae]USS93970.1 hypothetical protein M8332_07035 [Fructilactobacillus ixorae]
MVDTNEINRLRHKAFELTELINNTSISNLRTLSKNIRELDEIKRKLHEATKHIALKGF